MGLGGETKCLHRRQVDAVRFLKEGNSAGGDNTGLWSILTRFRGEGITGGGGGVTYRAGGPR